MSSSSSSSSSLSSSSSPSSSWSWSSWSWSSLQELINEIDQDGNGAISFNEFVWLMTRLENIWKFSKYILIFAKYFWILANQVWIFSKYLNICQVHLYFCQIFQYVSICDIFRYIMIYLDIEHISNLMSSWGWRWAYITTHFKYIWTFGKYLGIVLYCSRNLNPVALNFVGDNSIHCTSQCIEVLSSSEKRNQASEFNRCHTSWDVAMKIHRKIICSIKTILQTWYFSHAPHAAHV